MVGVSISIQSCTGTGAAKYGNHNHLVDIGITSLSPQRCTVLESNQVRMLCISTTSVPPISPYVELKDFMNKALLRKGK